MNTRLVFLTIVDAARIEMAIPCGTRFAVRSPEAGEPVLGGVSRDASLEKKQSHLIL